MNFNINEIAEAVQGALFADKNERSKIISTRKIFIDSRKAELDSVFIAMKGDNVDGHDFIENAIKSGASVIIANKEYCCKNNDKFAGVFCIAVDDTKRALLDLATLCINTVKPLVIGVTGSVGKTTTKEFIYSVIAQKYKTHKNIGNFNTETGLPLTVFALEDDAKVAVLEMGMNSFGEIDRLSKTARPDIAVITNIGTSHIEMLGSRENIKKAKFEILNGMNDDGHIILNADEPLLYSEKGKTGKKEIFFGIENKSSDVYAKNIRIDYKLNLTKFDIDYKGQTISVNVPSSGIHNVYNALAAISAGIMCGLDFEEIQSGINNFENGKMRQNIYDFHGITIIDDCYNASLESMNASFEVLRGIASETGGRKIAVLSDILESGDYSDEIHRKIGYAAVEKDIDIAFIYGEKSRQIIEGVYTQSVTPCESKCICRYFEDKSNIAELLTAEVRKDDVILFKASRGMAVETVMQSFLELAQKRFAK